MNYAQLPGEAQTRLLTNAVFLPQRETVRILIYAEHTPAEQSSIVEGILADQARPYELMVENDPAEIPGRLDRALHDVFLVLDQPTAPSGHLGTIGTAWNGAIEAYAESGGVVVVLSGGGGTGEMSDFFTQSGVLEVSSESAFTSQVAYNQAPGSAVGIGVISPFLTLPNTCRFTTSVTPGGRVTFVISDTNPNVGTGQPIVVHRSL